MMSSPICQRARDKERRTSLARKRFNAKTVCSAGTTKRKLKTRSVCRCSLSLKMQIPTSAGSKKTKPVQRWMTLWWMVSTARVDLPTKCSKAKATTLELDQPNATLTSKFIKAKSCWSILTNAILWNKNPAEYTTLTPLKLRTLHPNSLKFPANALFLEPTLIKGTAGRSSAQRRTNCPSKHTRRWLKVILVTPLIALTGMPSSTSAVEASKIWRRLGWPSMTAIRSTTGPIGTKTAQEKQTDP